MKAVFIFLAVLFTTCRCFARTSEILVDVTAHDDGLPTVVLCFSTQTDQHREVSIPEAAGILEKITELDGTNVYVLVHGRVQNEPLWALLEGLKKNSMATLVYLEADRFFVAGRRSLLSKRGEELEVAFKVPDHTKAVSQ